MDLATTLKAILPLFLNGSVINDLEFDLPYPECEVANAMPDAGWVETNDQHGNAVFIPMGVKDAAYCHTWIALSSEGDDECHVHCGHC